MSVGTFWSAARWGRAYGYRPGAGEDNPYTLGYHIGQDVKGRDWAGPVPVLRAGRVAASGRSTKIGGFVSIEVAGRFDIYCHLNSTSLPKPGTWLNAGDDLPPLARSMNPKAGHDYMGSASDGPHCHFVNSSRADGAHNVIRGCDTDPRPIIRAALTATASTDAKPFTPEQEEIIMSADRFIVSHKVSPTQTNLYLVGAGVKGGFQWISPGFFDIATAGWWNLTDGDTLLANVPTFDTRGNNGTGSELGNTIAFDLIKKMYADDPAAVTVDVDESAIAGQVIAALSPATLAQQIVAAGVAKAVADELSKRLAS